MKRNLILGALALATLGQPALAGKEDNSLNAAFTRDVATLDSYKATGREALVLARLLYDGLVSKNHETGEFVPELATSYEVVSDTEMVFKIRQGVKFHDGSDFTADDVVYTLNLVSKPEYGARYAIAVDWIELAEKIDDETVKLTMKSAFPMALEMLAGNLPIYSKAFLEANGPEGMAANPIGTGPYKLVDTVQGVEFDLERFEDYYEGGQKDDAQIETLTFRVLPEANTQYAELLNGSIDWIWRVPQDDVSRLASMDGVKTEAAPIMRISFGAFNPNIEGSPLAEQKVRQAILHGVNRVGIRDALEGEGSPLMDTPCNPIQFGCDADVAAPYPYDVDKAKALLDEAGYAEGFELSMALVANLSAAEVIKANLAELGIDLSIEQLQYASAIDKWRNGEVDILFSTWGSYGIGDAQLSLGNFFGGTGDDMVQDEATVAEIQEAGRIVDQEKRAELFSSAVERISTQAWWMPMWVHSLNTAMDEDLVLHVDPDEFVPFYDARWE